MEHLIEAGTKYYHLIISHKELILAALGLLWIVFTSLGLITPSNDKKGFWNTIGRICDRIGTKIKK